MTLAVRLSIGFAVGAALAYAATPYAIRTAKRLRFHDKPTGYKGHEAATPYLGGAAVMVGFVIAVLLAAGHASKTAPLLGGAAAMFILGTIDDRRSLGAGPRVFIELALAVLVWATDLGWKLHAGAGLDLALTCLWVLAVVNAFNLFDNMDGAAATMALVVAAGAATIGVARGDAWLAVGAASLCGSCLGFLPRNLSLPAARIFLGDGGSMPVGFAVSVLVMVAADTATATWRSLLVALLLIAIPALDTSLVVFSRRRRGVSVLSGGRDHLTHRARRFLPSARAVVLALAAMQAALSVLAVLASQGGSALLVISASLYVLVASLAIIALDTQQIEEFGVEGRTIGSRAMSKRAVAALGVLGLGAGLSPFFFAYYDATKWVPIGLAITLVCAVAIVIRPRRPGGAAALTLIGLLGLGVFSLLSTAWSESVENAVVSGNRWLVYGALMLLVLALVSHERRAAVLLAAAGIGIAAVAFSVLARLLGSDPASLFLNDRLNAPLGYVNGEGCLFAMGVWPCIALAETRRHGLAGIGAALATLMGCLALLSQSRGTALAMAVSLIAVLALAPGRPRRAWGLLLVAGGVAVAGPSLLHVYDHYAAASIPSTIGHSAGRAALLASVAVGIVWGIATLAWDRSNAHGGLARAGSWLLVVPILIALVLAATSAVRVERDLKTQWHAFVHLTEPGENLPSAASVSRSRLLSGGGNRYDYWRIASRLFADNPAGGVGAGNYPRSYFQRRRTTEDVQQPHSIEMQALSELGLPGILLLGAFVAGVGWGAVRMRRSALRFPLRRSLMVAALGMFAAWLTQASVDWMHLLPGVTAIALMAAVALVWPARRARAGASELGRSRLGRALRGRRALALGLSSVIVTLIVAGASLSRQGLAQVYRSRAQDELAAHPAAALADVNRSLDIDSDSLQSYYIKSAALARFNQPRGAEAALGQALAHERDNFVTWALLGDIAVRRRRFSLAQRYYLRAHQLNPRNPTLSQLARDPRAATS